MPESLQVRGALLLSPDRIVVWSGTERLSVLGRRGIVRTTSLPDSAAVVDVIADGIGGALALDQRGLRLFAIDSAMNVATAEDLAIPAGLQPFDAGRVQGATLLGAFDSVTASYVVMSIRSGNVSRLWGIRAVEASADDPPYRISVLDNSAFLAETRPPFGILSLGVDGRAVQVYKGDPNEDIHSLVSQPMWRALQIVVLDRGSLQSRTSLAADSRRIVRFSHTWQRATDAALTVPLALLGADRATRSLLAARFAGGLELVVYSWQWH